MSSFDKVGFGVVLGFFGSLVYLGVKTLFTKHQCCCPEHGNHAHARQ